MTDEQKKRQKEFSSCFEGMPFAEMMGKMTAGQGVGSLCAEMMQKIIDRQETGCGFGCSRSRSFDCTEMMEKMMTMSMCSGLQKEEEKTPEE